MNIEINLKRQRIEETNPAAKRIKQEPPKLKSTSSIQLEKINKPNPTKRKMQG